MNSTDVIRTFLQERLGVTPAELLPETGLRALGIDSLMLAELMFEAEDRLGISITSDQGVPTTVGELQTLIDALAAAKQG
ncbi:MAG TPA: acyl carrier protein [Macromonas sp.]|nr:acyl carrier protein [Macromonas sp.]